MAAMIERAQERGELRRGVASLRLAKNLFALHFEILLEWLGAAGITPERDRALRSALELHLFGTAPVGENHDACAHR
jgi:hypothetical protein